MCALQSYLWQCIHCNILLIIKLDDKKTVKFSRLRYETLTNLLCLARNITSHDSHSEIALNPLMPVGTHIHTREQSCMGR